MLKQSLSQKLLQKLSPQQIQLMKLLQVPTIELEQRIKQEIEENPALEEGVEQRESDDPYEGDSDDISDAEREFDINDYLDDDLPQYKTNNNNYSGETDEKSVPIAQGESFQEQLLQQIHLRRLSEEEQTIAEVIIGNLDENGYLRRDVENIADDLAFSYNLQVNDMKVEEVLLEVQELDPPGIAARDLQECLLIQLERKTQSPEVQIALEVIDRCFDEFTKKHYDRIAKRLNISTDELKSALEEILKLNPKPGGTLKSGDGRLQQIVPDYTLVEEEGDLKLLLNGRNAPDLKVNREYETMLRSYGEGAKQNKDQKEATMFIKQKLESAKWFIDAIKQRQNTLLVTMQAILEYQKEYFLSGDETQLKPMILKDIAEKVGLDISTISRVANSKYIQTPYGTFPLKYFFSESLSTDSGEEVSTREVKKILSDAVESEEKKKPLTDDKLAKLLQDKGYNIARRTVAKYREQLNIPVARLRKEL